MRLSPRCRASLSVALFGLLSAADAAGADWTYVESDPARGDLQAFSPYAAGNGVDVLGFANGKTMFARYAANGALALLRDVRLGYDFGTSALDVQPMRDGGTAALFFSEGAFMNPLCFPARLDAQGGVRWQRGDSAFSPPCTILGSDDGGAIWLRAGSTAQRYSADGVLVANVALFDDFGTHAIGGTVAADGTLYALANNGAGGVPVLAAYTINGTARALWTGTDATVSFQRLAFGSDGNLFAIGADASNVRAASFSTAGALRWQQSVPAGAAPQLTATAAGADGSVYALDQREFLYAFGSDGRVLFGNPFGAGHCASQYCPMQLAITPQGDALALFQDDTPQLMRQNFQSTTTTATGLTQYGPNFGALAALADGTAVLPASVGTPGYTLLRIARDGSALAPLPTAALVDADRPMSAAAASDAGDVYVLSAQPGATPGHGYALSRVTADGRLAWKQPLAADAYYVPGLQLGSDRICYQRFGLTGLEPTIVECRATADGTLLWSTSLAYNVQAMSLLPDGSIVAVSDGYQVDSVHLLLDAQGHVVHSIDLGHAFRAVLDGITFAPNGTTIVSAFDYFPDGALYAWDRDGHLLYSVKPDLDLNHVGNGPIIAAADGSVVLAPASDGNVSNYLWSVSPTGQTRWLSGEDRRAVSVHLPKIDNDAVYVTDFGGPGNTLEVSKFALSDGKRLSGGAVSGAVAPYSSATIRADHASGLLIATYLSPANVTQVSLIDPQQASVLRTYVVDCGGTRCVGADYDNSIYAALSSDGTLRVASGGEDENLGVRARIDAFEHALSAPTVRIDQAGLDGDWFAPYESGQGFAFDYIASANTVFMPWFTYAQPSTFTGPASGSQGDPAGPLTRLAWYTLQGTVTAGARSVDLVIGSADPGGFDVGAVGAHAVGSATLMFSDCQSGLLLYQFTNGSYGPYGGMIALTRLTPSTSPCVLADGSSAPAQVANLPAQGFDARQSGSWFEPTTAGQGLQITVVPPGGNYPGLLFAPWFTFDPSGHGDDAAQSHWFTLQGDLSAAHDGSVTVPILRTIGGEFDAFGTGDTVAVGHATLTFQGCATAHLAYTFDTSEVAHAFAGLSGAMDLAKIGGCSAP